MATQTGGLKGIEKEFLQDLQMKAMLRRFFGLFTVMNAQEAGRSIERQRGLQFLRMTSGGAAEESK